MDKPLVSHTIKVFSGNAALLPLVAEGASVYQPGTVVNPPAISNSIGLPVKWLIRLLISKIEPEPYADVFNE
jgi:hypothetical protein